MNRPVLVCHGGVGTVTGANFLLEVGGKKYLIDCGLLQGLKEEGSLQSDSFDYVPASIEALFVTHAHIDHIGRIPKLIESGFKGVIYSTPETMEIAQMMLRDLVRIEGMKAQSLDKAKELWRGIKYHEPKEFDGFKLELFDAGHILGSAMYKFIFPSGKSMLFTGDLGNSPSPLLRDTDPVSGLTYLLMESVYGDRNHQSVEAREKEFAELVQSVVREGRTLIIPIFSLERTQVILFTLHKLFESGELKKIPVFLDSPLAIRLTELYKKLTGRDIFSFPTLHNTLDMRDSSQIESVRGAKIIMAGSGMSTAGRILFHEERYLPDPNAVILFVGFQAPGTLGRQIIEGVMQVEVNGKVIEVKARVEKIHGFSAHAGSDQLVDFVAHSKETLKRVFVAMGEPKSSIFLAQRLHDELGVEAVVGEKGKRYELDL